MKIDIKTRVKDIPWQERANNADIDNWDVGISDCRKGQRNTQAMKISSIEEWYHNLGSIEVL